ncbi:unnamed protein product, partial [Ascophyllum nodosum]
MAAEQLRSRVQEHWRAFDTLAESQSGANEAIIRALEVFAGAREKFSATDEETSLPSPQAGVPGGDRQPSAGASFPRGSANAGDDGARASYFTAEESLVLAREQLARSERTLELMAEEVEGARRRIGSCYNTEETRGQEERERVRARASLHALERGGLGCLMSPVDMTRAMASLLRMHQSELEMQETIVNDVGYSTPGEVLTAYREALSLRAFMDDRFLSQVQEMRELSAELEQS